MSVGFHPQPKPQSRVQARKAAKPGQDRDALKFRLQIWLLDGGRCRKCHRKVIHSLERLPERGEVNHVHGRLGDLLYETRAALLLCLSCHEQFTGRVAEKWIIVPTKRFTLHGKRYTNAREPVTFQRVA